MKSFEYKFTTDSISPLSYFITQHNKLHQPHKSNTNQSIFYLDIETTGFNRKIDQIYLLGILSIAPNGLPILEQYLCQKPSDEYELLYTLNQRLNDGDILIHFNGDSFDLPFIKARMALYGINETLSLCQSMDYYKLLRPFKKIFKTDNFKLKTLEKIATYTRFDTYSGGELISLYTDYLQGNLLVESTFIEHNKEDLLGLFYLNAYNPLFQLTQKPPLLYFNDTSVRNSTPVISNIKPQSTMYELVWEEFQPPRPTGKFEFESFNQDYTLQLIDGNLTLTLPIEVGTFKYFYDDYQNYYYLTDEDYAIHKVVADFVSSKHKKKATKATAYIKKSGKFVSCPLPKSVITRLFEEHGKKIPVFQESVNSTSSFLYLDDFKLCHSLLYIPIVQVLFF